MTAVVFKDFGSHPNPNGDDVILESEHLL